MKKFSLRHACFLPLVVSLAGCNTLETQENIAIEVSGMVDGQSGIVPINVGLNGKETNKRAEVNLTVPSNGSGDQHSTLSILAISQATDNVVKNRKSETSEERSEPDPTK